MAFGHGYKVLLRASSTILVNVSGSWMAMSASVLRSRLDRGPLQAGDELAIAHAAHPAGGVDADDPQPAELAFLDAAIAKSVDAGRGSG